MNILHLSSNLKFGGSEQQLIYLINATNTKGLKNYIFCFNTSILLDYKSIINGEIVTVKEEKAYKKSLLKALRDIVFEKKIDIIHIHNGKFVLTYMLTDIFYKLPCKTIFSKKDMSTSSSVFSKIKYNYRGIIKVTCVTEAIKERFKDLLYKKNHHKLVVLRDGLSLETLHQKTASNIHSKFNIENNKFIIGNVANHVRAKDLGTLILTLDYLVNTLNFKNIHLIQIGRFSNDTQGLKQLIKEKQLKNYITFTGFIQDGYQFTSQFNAFIMSSQSEGLPLTILESFYYKIPVISTKAGGIPEAITHNKNGLLANIKDFKTLALHVKTILESKALSTKITENAYKLVVERFTSNRMADQTIALYNQLLNKN